MTNEEAIELIRIAQAEIEWDYPMEYAIAFDKAIEALEAAGWVSVKDKLPEHGKRYLIYATSGDNKTSYITIAAFSGHFYLSGRRAYWKVTHWMPLPELPKEEGLQ